jgi:hypothetical protein
MTTEEVVTPTDAELLQLLQRARAAQADPRSLVLSEIDRRTYDGILARLDGAIQGMRNALNALEIPTARVAEWRPRRERMLAAKAVLEKQRDAAGDWRTVKDSRARDGAWARQEAITASLKAIRVGVEYFNGEPAVPAPLAALLMDTCPSGDLCPHGRKGVLQWHGSLPAIEEQIAEAQQRISHAHAHLAHYRAEALNLLALAAPQGASHD